MPAANSYDPQSRALLWKRRWEYCREFDRPQNEKYERELEFALKLKHWDSDAGGSPPTTKADRFKGRELYSKLRRTVAEAMAAFRKEPVTCAPVDRDSDPRAASAARFPVEHVTRTPSYGFEIYLERAVWSALAARRGWIVVEWDERINDMVFRNPDPRRVFLTPGCFDPWERTLPYLIEQVPMRLSDARSRFPDLDLIADLTGNDLDVDLSRNDVQNKTLRGSNPEADTNDEGTVLALLCWSQFDGETEPRVVGKRPPEGGPYAYCPECSGKGAIEDAIAGAQCPECLRSSGKAVEMKPALSEDFVEDAPKFPGGRTLEVVFPLQTKCHRGPWPLGPNGEQLRMPPYMLFRRSEHPTEFAGLSDTAVDAPMQTLSNQLMERMRRQVQGPSTVAAMTGKPEDADGNPWQPTDDPFQMAYMPDQAATIHTIQLAEVSASLFSAINMVQEQFRADLGTFDLSAQGADDVKGVAVGTVEAAAKSGSVPTDHFIQRMFYALAGGYGVILDWIRIGWNEGRWVRMRGTLGRTSYQLVAGADVPNADFVFGQGGDKRIADAKEFQAAMQWYQTGMPPGSPALRRALAEAGVAPVSIELVDDIEKAEAEAAEAAANAMPVGGDFGPDAAGMGGAGQDPNGPEAGTPAGGGLAPDDLAAMLGARGMA